MIIMVIRFSYKLPCYTALYEERADDGGEYSDDELDDGLPTVHVFQ